MCNGLANRFGIKQNFVGPAGDMEAKQLNRIPPAGYSGVGVGKRPTTCGVRVGRNWYGLVHLRRDAYDTTEGPVCARRGISFAVVARGIVPEEDGTHCTDGARLFPGMS